MKRNLIMAAIFSLLMATPVFPMGVSPHIPMKETVKDDEGHILSLWKDFYQAQKADRPKREAEILDEIKAEAKERRLAWDFYRAGKLYIDVTGSRNWKTRDSLKMQFASEISAFDCPIATFSYLRDDNKQDTLFGYVQANRGKMETARNEAFYDKDFAAYYSNDYEYALWKLLPYRKGHLVEDPAYLALNSYLDGKYPNGAYLEYYLASSSGKGPDLEAVAAKYEGKAVSLFPRQDLLSMKFDSLQKAKAASEDYKALLKECQAYDNEKASYSGSEAKISKHCTKVEGIVKSLKSRQVSSFIIDDTLKVVLRNLSDAKVTVYKLSNENENENADHLQELKKRSPTYERNVYDEKRSFFVQDTLSVILPDFDDGYYAIVTKSQSESANTYYLKHTLSLAQRRDAKGFSIYLADYLSGKPVEMADLELTKGGKSVGEEPDFKFDGFTRLPSSFEAIIESHGGAYYELACSFRDSAGRMRSSNNMGLMYEKKNAGNETADDCSGIAFTDRGAYNPGDTVHFKGVFYKGEFSKSVRTYPAGKKVKVFLHDADGNELFSKSIATNEFGSVAGEFVLPRGRKNGTFGIAMDFGSASDISCHFIVDEFVLPTFDLVFKRSDKLFFPGDTVHVDGTVTSYSGHSLSEAVASYKVIDNGKVCSEGPLPIRADGSFSSDFAIAKDGYHYYYITVAISDATGETHEYSKVVHTSYRIFLNVDLTSKADGSVKLPVKNGLRKVHLYRKSSGSDDGQPYEVAEILKGNVASFKFTVRNPEGEVVDIPVSYVLSDEKDRSLFCGTADSGSEKDFDLSAYPSGLYQLQACAKVKDGSGKYYNSEVLYSIAKVDDSDKVLNAPLEYYLKPDRTQVEPGSDFSIAFGSTTGPIWAIAELYGKDRTLLDSRFVHLDGERGKEGSLVTLAYRYEKEYPDDVFFRIFYFRNSEEVSYGRHFHRTGKSLVLPLSFSSFRDKTYPDTKYTFAVKTLPGVECLAAVFDKSSDTVHPNEWYPVAFPEFRVEDVNVDAVCGGQSKDMWNMLVGRVSGVEQVAYGRSPVLFRSKTKSSPMLLEESTVVGDDMDRGNEQTPADIGNYAIRDKFSNTLTFQPFLHSDNDGDIEFSFKTSGKLSTYHVALFAHAKDMKNATVRKEMLVTMPLKVSVAEPAYLYRGDSYSLNSTVSSNADRPISGVLSMYSYSGRDYKHLQPFASKSVKLTVPAGGVVSASFEVQVPSPVKGVAGSFPQVPDSLGLMTVFAADDASGGTKLSDGVFVAVPVLENLQTIVEAHSAVLLPGMDKDSLSRVLEREFVNVPATGAEYSEISVMDMVKSSIPAKAEPEGKDVLSLSEACYVRLLAAKLGCKMEEGNLPVSELLAKINACRNADGGFGWFEGMDSSPIITAVILERIAKMRDSGLIGISSFGDVDASVKYLDYSQFGVNLPIFRGTVSIDQYLLVRSMFPSVPFNVKPIADAKDFNKSMSEFKKYVRSYLIPGNTREMNGYILGKARRALTLENLTASSAGTDLANSWGVRFAADSRMRKSMNADVVSLEEYAVVHKDGGIYFPNAVMPWRGLLESEAYAHSLLCDLLGKYGREGRKIADGVRVWLMLQKETQHWDATPDYLDAINSVISGSEEVKEIRILKLNKAYEKPFDQIKAAGNGFEIDRRFFREVTSGDKNLSLEEIKEGDTLRKGDKIVARYEIWNAENRSFVKLIAPREACLRPANQLSGPYGWKLSPLHIGSFVISPQGYRNVKTDRTEYYFDCYPEEKTAITEEFFVVQAGVFSAPVATIESLYAEHYRANDNFFGKLLVK